MQKTLQATTFQDGPETRVPFLLHCTECCVRAYWLWHGGLATHPRDGRCCNCSKAVTGACLGLATAVSTLVHSVPTVGPRHMRVVIVLPYSKPQSGSCVIVMDSKDHRVKSWRKLSKHAIWSLVIANFEVAECMAPVYGGGWGSLREQVVFVNLVHDNVDPWAQFKVTGIRARSGSAIPRKDWDIVAPETSWPSPDFCWLDSVLAVKWSV